MTVTSRVSYMDRAAVARAVDLLTEIRARYRQIVAEFPKSERLGYYREHIDGLAEAIELLESLRVS